MDELSKDCVKIADRSCSAYKCKLSCSPIIKAILRTWLINVDPTQKDDLIASGKGELFGENGPPLPSGNMLMMDRIVSMTEDGGTFNKGYVEAELDINPDLWFFGCHFTNDPVMPGCLGLDAMAVSWLLSWLAWR